MKPAGTQVEHPGKLTDLGERRVAVGAEVTPEGQQLDLASNRVVAHLVRLAGTIDAFLVRDHRWARATPRA